MGGGRRDSMRDLWMKGRNKRCHLFYYYYNYYYLKINKTHSTKACGVRQGGVDVIQNLHLK